MSELKPRISAQILDEQWGGLALMMLNEGIKVYGFLLKLSLYMIIPCFCTNDFVHYSYFLMSKNQPNDCWKMHKIHNPCGLGVNYLLYLLCWISIIFTLFLWKSFKLCILCWWKPEAGLKCLLEGTVPHILVATDICRTFMAALRIAFPSDVILLPPSKSMMSCSNRSTAHPPTLHTSAGSFPAIMAGPKPI